MKIETMLLVKAELLKRMPTIKDANMENGVEKIIDLANDCLESLGIHLESEEEINELTEFLKPTVKEGLMEIMKKNVDASLNSTINKIPKN